MEEKYYTDKQIYSATFFGGPIPAGILIFKNLKRIGNEKNAALTLALTFVFTILLFFLFIHPLGSFLEKIPDFIFTAFYTFIVYLLYSRFLEKEIGEKIKLPENKESNWTVAGITIFGLLLNIVIIFGFAYLEPTFPGENVTFGNLEHEVFFDKEEFSKSQVQKLGKMLTDLEYFSDMEKQSVRIERRDENIFLLMPLQKEYWEDQGIINELNNFNIRLRYELKTQTTIELIHYELNGDIKTKNITSFANNGL
jgi:hypothetical protein